MNYETAKKLKNAGFPQYIEKKGRTSFFSNGTTGEDFYAPTLEELIEAIGDDFHCLVYTTNGGMDSDRKFWSAGTSRYVKDWQNGSTPEEAVANLYLALHPSE